MRTIKNKRGNPTTKAERCPILFQHNLDENEKDESGVWFYPQKKGRGSYPVKYRLNFSEGETKIFLTKKMISNKENFDYELNKVIRFNYVFWEIETVVFRRGNNKVNTGTRTVKHSQGKKREYITEKSPFGVMGWRTKTFDILEGSEIVHNLINTSDEINHEFWNKVFAELIKNSFIGSVEKWQDINIY